MKNDKKAVDRDQTDGCRYSTCGFQSEGRDQPLSEASAANGQKSDNCQHTLNRLWSDGYFVTDDNAKGYC